MPYPHISQCQPLFSAHPLWSLKCLYSLSSPVKHHSKSLLPSANLPSEERLCMCGICNLSYWNGFLYSRSVLIIRYTKQEACGSKRCSAQEGEDWGMGTSLSSVSCLCWVK